jgi:hypothetical protein
MRLIQSRVYASNPNQALKAIETELAGKGFSMKDAPRMWKAPVQDRASKGLIWYEYVVSVVECEVGA